MNLDVFRYITGMSNLTKVVGLALVYICPPPPSPKLYQSVTYLEHLSA